MAALAVLHHVWLQRAARAGCKIVCSPSCAGRAPSILCTVCASTLAWWQFLYAGGFCCVGMCRGLLCSELADWMCDQFYAGLIVKIAVLERCFWMRSFSHVQQCA